jgi:hypothetical protein
MVFCEAKKSLKCRIETTKGTLSPNCLYFLENLYLSFSLDKTINLEIKRQRFLAERSRLVFVQEIDLFWKV